MEMPLQQVGHPKGSGWNKHPHPEHHPLPSAGELPLHACGMCHSQARTNSAGQHCDAQDLAVSGCSHPSSLQPCGSLRPQERKRTWTGSVGWVSWGAWATWLVLCRDLNKGHVSESTPFAPSRRASLSSSPSPSSSPSLFPSPSPSLPHICACSEAHQEHPRLAVC